MNQVLFAVKGSKKPSARLMVEEVWPLYLLLCLPALRLFFFLGSWMAELAFGVTSLATFGAFGGFLANSSSDLIANLWLYHKVGNGLLDDTKQTPNYPVESYTCWRWPREEHDHEGIQQHDGAALFFLFFVHTDLHEERLGKVEESS